MRRGGSVISARYAGMIRHKDGRVVHVYNCTKLNELGMEDYLGDIVLDARDDTRAQTECEAKYGGGS